MTNTNIKAHLERHLRAFAKEQAECQQAVMIRERMHLRLWGTVIALAWLGCAALALFFVSRLW